MVATQNRSGSKAKTGAKGEPIGSMASIGKVTTAKGVKAEAPAPKVKPIAFDQAKFDALAAQMEAMKTAKIDALKAQATEINAEMTTALAGLREKLAAAELPFAQRLDAIAWEIRNLMGPNPRRQRAATDGGGNGGDSVIADAIVAHLRAHGRSQTSAIEDVIAPLHTGTGRLNSVSWYHLSRLTNEGRIRKVGRGLYEVVEGAPTAAGTAA